MLVKKGANIWNIAAACYLCAHYKPNIKEKMKKFLAIAVLAVSLVACNEAADTSAERTKDSLDSIANAQINVIDSSADAKIDAIDSTTEVKKDLVDSLNKDTVNNNN